jgi:hypothetical protein
MESPLEPIVRELDAQGIPYMVAGSLASTYHGDPRTTRDMDLVILASKTEVDRFVEDLDPAQFYVSREAAEEAWRRGGQFEVVDLASGWKTDLILCKDRPFSLSEFERSERGTVFGTEVFVATAEDTILAKLEWALHGESERQLRDVVGILEVSGTSLDRSYIERWAGELGVDELWQRVQLEAER